MAVFAWISNVAALANVGANYHYLILPWFSTMFLLPAGLKQLEGWASRASWVPVAIFCLSTAIMVRQRTSLTVERPAALDASILAHMKVLSDWPYLEVRSGEPQLFDPFTYHEFLRNGVWSDAAIRQRVDAEEYDLLLIGGRRKRFGIPRDSFSAKLVLEYR